MDVGNTLFFSFGQGIQIEPAAGIQRINGILSPNVTLAAISQQGDVMSPHSTEVLGTGCRIVHIFQDGALFGHQLRSIRNDMLYLDAGICYIGTVLLTGRRYTQQIDVPGCFRQNAVRCDLHRGTGFSYTVGCLTCRVHRWDSGITDANIRGIGDTDFLRNNVRFLICTVAQYISLVAVDDDLMTAGIYRIQRKTACGTLQVNICIGLCFGTVPCIEGKQIFLGADSILTSSGSPCHRGRNCPPCGRYSRRGVAGSILHIQAARDDAGIAITLIRQLYTVFSGYINMTRRIQAVYEQLSRMLQLHALAAARCDSPLRGEHNFFTVFLFVCLLLTSFTNGATASFKQYVDTAYMDGIRCGCLIESINGFCRLDTDVPHLSIAGVHRRQGIYLVQQDIILRGQIYIALRSIFSRSGRHERSAIEQDVQRPTAGNSELAIRDGIVIALGSSQCYPLFRREFGGIDVGQRFIINDLVAADRSADQRNVLAGHICILDDVICIGNRLGLPLRLGHRISTREADTGELCLRPPCVILNGLLVSITELIAVILVIFFRSAGYPRIRLQFMVVLQLGSFIVSQLGGIVCCVAVGIMQGCFLRIRSCIDFLAAAVLGNLSLAGPVFLIGSIHVQTIIVLRIGQTLLGSLTACDQSQIRPVLRELIPAALVNMLIHFIVNHCPRCLETHISCIGNSPIEEEIALDIFQTDAAVGLGIEAVFRPGCSGCLAIVHGSRSSQRCTCLNTEHILCRTQGAVIRYEVYPVRLDQAVCIAIDDAAVGFQHNLGSRCIACCRLDLAYPEVSTDFFQVDQSGPGCRNRSGSNGFRRELGRRMGCIPGNSHIRIQLNSLAVFTNLFRSQIDIGRLEQTASLLDVTSRIRKLQCA